MYGGTRAAPGPPISTTPEQNLEFLHRVQISAKRLVALIWLLASSESEGVVTTDQDLYNSAFGRLFITPLSEMPSPPRLLAHYTSINVMESILQTRQIWFSNPLFMNDLQEVRFGIREGHRLFSNMDLLKKAVSSDQRIGIVGNAFTAFFGNFDTNEVFDT
jgi:hypothetical protein